MAGTPNATATIPCTNRGAHGDVMSAPRRNSAEAHDGVGGVSSVDMPSDRAQRKVVVMSLLGPPNDIKLSGERSESAATRCWVALRTTLTRVFGRRTDRRL